MAQTVILEKDTDRIEVEMDNALVFERVNGEETTTVCRGEHALSEAVILVYERMSRYLAEGYSVANLSDEQRDEWQRWYQRARRTIDESFRFPRQLENLAQRTPARVRSTLLGVFEGQLDEVADSMIDYITSPDEYAARGVAAGNVSVSIDPFSGGRSSYLTTRLVGRGARDALLPWLIVGSVGAADAIAYLFDGTVFAVHHDEWFDLIDDDGPLIEQIERVGAERNIGRDLRGLSNLVRRCSQLERPSEGALAVIIGEEWQDPEQVEGWIRRNALLRLLVHGEVASWMR